MHLLNGPGVISNNPKWKVPCICSVWDLEAKIFISLDLRVAQSEDCYTGHHTGHHDIVLKFLVGRFIQTGHLPHTWSTEGKNCITLSLIFISVWPCQQSSWNCNLSVVCPSVRVAIISEPNSRISFKFWLLVLLGHTLGRFFNFWKEKKNGICFEYFSLTRDLMGVKTSKRYPPTKRSRKFSNLSWIFFLMVPTKPMFGIFKSLKIETREFICHKQ